MTIRNVVVCAGLLAGIVTTPPQTEDALPHLATPPESDPGVASDPTLSL